MTGTLEGISVLDLTEGIAGGFCTRLLAGFGAEVIKVEQPGTGDAVRGMGVFKDDVPSVETSAVHLHLSMAKKSITLDLETTTGRDLLRRLIAASDIVVESFTPGTLEGWGLGYEEMQALRPAIILTSITSFGQTGPYATYQGNDLVDYSVGAYTYITGLPDREPIKAGGSQAENQGGLHAAIATMAALFQREFSGAGDHIDLAVTEAVAFTSTAMAAYLNDGVVYGRVGARLLSNAPTANYPSTVLPCKGGFIHAHWAPTDPALMGVLTGNPRLSDEELWATPRGHADEIHELLTAWLADKTKFEAVTLAQELRHPFTEVLNPADLLDDPQFVARNFFVELDHPETGPLKHLGAPVIMSESTWRAQRAPLLGEHNVEVYRDRLGLGGPELNTLRDRGVI